MRLVAVLPGDARVWAPRCEVPNQPVTRIIDLVIQSRHAMYRGKVCEMLIERHNERKRVLLRWQRANRFAFRE